MPVTDQDARAIAYLAGRIREEMPRAPRWDRAGIDAEVARLVGRDLAPTIERVIRHAADPDALTPGAIRRPWVPEPTPETPRNVTPAEACRTCGGRYPTCCDQPTRRPQPSPIAAQHLQGLRGQLAVAREAMCACGVDARSCRDHKPEGVGTGAGEGATGQDTGTAWVTRSTDCPEAPAQAHPLDRRDATTTEETS